MAGISQYVRRVPYTDKDGNRREYLSTKTVTTTKRLKVTDADVEYFLCEHAAGRGIKEIAEERGVAVSRLSPAVLRYAAKIFAEG